MPELLDIEELTKEIEKQPFFHGTMLKGEASGLLIQDGDFLVRKYFVKGEPPNYGLYVKTPAPKVDSKAKKEPDNEEIQKQKAVISDLQKQLKNLQEGLKNKENNINQINNQIKGKKRDLATEERILEELKDEERYSYILDYEVAVINEERICILDMNGAPAKGVSAVTFSAVIDEFLRKGIRMPITKKSCLNDVVLKRAVGRASWEIPKDDILFDISDYLGKGSFGRVCRGTMMIAGGGSRPVAVKVSLTPEQQKRLEEEEEKRREDEKKKEAVEQPEVDEKKEGHYKKNTKKQVKPPKDYQKRTDYHLMKAVNAEKKKPDQEQWVLDFFKEVRAMRDVVHPHLVKMIGAVVESDPPALILELLEGGTLRNYLVNAEGGYTPSREKKKYALHAAWGIEFLHSKKMIHRDIAARNCLLHRNQQSEDYQLKISDFGLCRVGSAYTLKRDVYLPVKWMAPEALAFGHFDSKTDVWSFGCLLYEIYTNGKTPHGNLSLGEMQKKYADPKENRLYLDIKPVLEHEHGGTIATNLQWTMDVDPAKRPTMGQLAKFFEEINDDAIPPVVLDRKRMDEVKQKLRIREEKGALKKLLNALKPTKTTEEATEQGSKMPMEQGSKMPMDNKKKVLTKKKSTDRAGKAKKSPAVLARRRSCL